MTSLPPASCRVYTPSNLAHAMVKALGDAPQAVWLEPSHGQGAFVEAIAGLGVKRERVFAIDLDPTTAPADKLANTVRGLDFVCWARNTEQRFDRIVGNPPFISINQLPRTLQATASSVLDLSGQPIGTGANLWYAFVLTSLRLLRCGGCLAFVLPSAAEFADYSVGIREKLREIFCGVELYRCTRPLFDSVQEGTLVAIARGYGQGPGLVRRRWFTTRSELIHGMSTNGRVNGRKCPIGSEQSDHKVLLKSIARIGLGGVTGDASFFLMNEAKRKSLRLPKSALIPVLSKAKHLRSALLTQREWDNLRSNGARVWLFNPSPATAKHSTVRRYLRKRESKGGCNRQAFKISNREPWFRTPLPPVPDAFLSGMSQEGPWLCINGTRKVNATNTLYVVRFSNRDRKTWFKWALALLSSPVRRQIRRIGRRYPDGLIKYEPGALNKINLPRLRHDVAHRELYTTAVSALLGGNLTLATKIADSALE